MSAILVAIIISDVLILFGFAYLFHLHRGGKSYLMEVTQERQLVDEMVARFNTKCDSISDRLEDQYSEVRNLAAQIDRDIAQHKTTLTTTLAECSESLQGVLKKDLGQLSQASFDVQALMNRVGEQKKSLARVIKRSEQLCAFFRSELPTEDILKEIEHNRLNDIITLLREGVDPKKVAEDLGVARQEIESISQLLVV